MMHIFRVVLAFCFLFMASFSSKIRVSRLILPTTNAELRIIPHVNFPSSLTNSVDSGVNFKLPITIKFPSMLDLFDPLKELVKDVKSGKSKVFSNKDSRSLNIQKFSRNRSRALFYEYLSSFNSTLATDCVLKTICQVNKVALVTPSLGLIGEIIDTLFRCVFTATTSSLVYY